MACSRAKSGATRAVSPSAAVSVISKQSAEAGRPLSCRARRVSTRSSDRFTRSMAARRRPSSRPQVAASRSHRNAESAALTSVSSRACAAPSSKEAADTRI